MSIFVSTQNVLTDEELKINFPDLEEIILKRRFRTYSTDDDDKGRIVDSTTEPTLLRDSVKSLFTTLSTRLNSKKSYAEKTDELFNKLKSWILPPKQGRVKRFFTKNTDVTLTSKDVELIENIVRELLKLNKINNNSKKEDIIRYIIRRYIQQKLKNNGILVETNNREGLFNKIFSGKKKLYVLFESTNKSIQASRDVSLKVIDSYLETLYCLVHDTENTHPIPTLFFSSPPTLKRYSIVEFDPANFNDKYAFTNAIHRGIGQSLRNESVIIKGVVFLYISGNGVDTIDEAMQVLDIYADEEIGGFSEGEYFHPGTQALVYSDPHSRMIPNFALHQAGKKRSSKKTTKRRCGNSKARYYRRCSPMKHPKKTIRQQRRRFSVRRKKHN